MGFGAKGMSSVAFNQFWKERVEKEEAEIVSGSEKAQSQNTPVVIQGPLGVSMVRTYAPPHRHKSSLRGSAAFVRTARDKKRDDRPASVVSSRAPSEAGSRMSGSSRASRASLRKKVPPAAPSQVSVSTIASGDRPPIKEITIPGGASLGGDDETCSNVSYPTTPHHSLAGTATEQVIQRLEDLEQQLHFERMKRLQTEKDMKELMVAAKSKKAG
ncbi:hypothetical protein HKI87_09g59050 [Chloropicon roscoffensis]|uniref:Uncharacterized protein n=1 Tax=Chloropicon roscoffensis TaxID=1461544 RepID=A0AAX4PDU3_9CHLO